MIFRITAQCDLLILKSTFHTRRSLVGGVFRREATIQTPGQTSLTKRSTEKKEYFFGNFLSADFWQKIGERLKIARNRKKEQKTNLLFEDDCKL